VQNEKLEKQKAHLMQVKQDSGKSFVLKGKRKVRYYVVLINKIICKYLVVMLLSYL
jgi:hypothetical protein